MKRTLILSACVLAAYFLFARKAGAVYADSGGADVGNPFYFSLGKIMQPAQHLSQAGLERLKTRERFSATPYNDPPGSDKWSIGYGHQIKPGESFTVISEATGELILESDVITAENAINNNVSATLTQNQFDALVSFVFNIGVGAFLHGSVPEKLNNGQFDAAVATMKLYKNSNGEESPILVARRKSEAAQFLA